MKLVMDALVFNFFVLIQGSKKLEFQLALGMSSSQILLALGKS